MRHTVGETNEGGMHEENQQYNQRQIEAEYKTPRKRLQNKNRKQTENQTGPQKLTQNLNYIHIDA